MSRPLMPKYMARDLAREATNFLRLRPALQWEDVDAFYQPRLEAWQTEMFSQYDSRTQEAVKRFLLREFKRLEMWRH